MEKRQLEYFRQISADADKDAEDTDKDELRERVSQKINEPELLKLSEELKKQRNYEEFNLTGFKIISNEILSRTIRQTLL